MKKLVLSYASAAACATIALAALSGGALADETQKAPAPRLVIYPGDLIRDDMLTDMDVERGAVSASATVIDRSALIGKMARQTLLPGRTIAVSAITSPRLVRNGAEVELVYAEGSLRIVTNGSALQEGGLDDVIKVRNLESGVTVSGVVQADGSVRVQGLAE